MNCPAKHTKYQPTEAEWKCPRCLATFDSKKPFYVQEPVDGTEDCLKLHCDDFLFCDTCGYSATGKSFAAQIVKAKNLKPCPHCNGTGLVKAT